MKKILHWNDVALRYIDLESTAAKHGTPITQLPYVIRLLLENVLRHQLLGRAIDEIEIRALISWREHISTQLSLHVERVILPDSSGLPVLQDLAALRDAVRKRGGDPEKVDTKVPVDVIVDHSLQVDVWGQADAVQRNLDFEFSRNEERYRFLKWAQQAFQGVRVFPPGSGIIHQVNLEHLATVVLTQQIGEEQWVFPDFVIGGDSHTPMINGLGVLGWGVGGIDAESALLGRAYSFPIPDVIGVRLEGAIPALATTTDAALLITQTLRHEGVSGCAVEFFGPGAQQLSVPERATIANMAPEYGATCGYFPVDTHTLEYLHLTGRSPKHIALIQAYCKTNHLWADASSPTPDYSRVITIDLSQAQPCMSGPRRPQDRLPLAAIKQDFVDRLHAPSNEGGFNIKALSSDRLSNNGLTHGRVILAAITSCTNTSNPSVMMTAGLIAKRAREKGLKLPKWVKPSLAPGSRAVTGYLQSAGLLAEMEALGFYVIGYGCTSCGGKSGPLSPEILADAESNDWVLCTVLSGNRNFEGRIHKLAKANYIGSPAMVMAYALAGRIDIDFAQEPIGYTHDGQAVWLHELWPSSTEVATLIQNTVTTQQFQQAWNSPAEGAQQWDELQANQGIFWSWEHESSYLVSPPFFDSSTPTAETIDTALDKTRVIGLFGDSLTTDHISPSGEIPIHSSAGQYLTELGIAERDFNTYVGRRCNFEVMTRATFDNIRIRNLLTPEREGGWTRYLPEDETMSIYAASRRYIDANVGTIILAGKEYGTGSSRDWAAKGTALLGIKAVIAKSFERIHRSNLIGMGVCPFSFSAGEGWQELGLDGTETYTFFDAAKNIQLAQKVLVQATHKNGRVVQFWVTPQAHTKAERDLLLQGGIMLSVLNDYLTYAQTQQ